jgi:hypothetical protein
LRFQATQPNTTIPVRAALTRALDTSPACRKTQVVLRHGTNVDAALLPAPLAPHTGQQFFLLDAAAAAAAGATGSAAATAAAARSDRAAFAKALAAAPADRPGPSTAAEAAAAAGGAAKAPPAPATPAAAQGSSSSSSTAHLPLLLQMTQDCPDRGLYFYSALAAFKTRTAYANMGGAQRCRI